MFRRVASALEARQDAAAVELVAKANARIEETLKLAREHDLLALARGKREPSDAAELAEAAYFAYSRGEARIAARAYARGFEAFPELLTTFPHRYNAACSAALAAAATELPEAERAPWRERARTWLQEEVALWRANVSDETKRDAALANLTHALQDADFASVRAEEALAELPTAESEAWRALWREIGGPAAKDEEKR